jgi:hypothetical protein
MAEGETLGERLGLSDGIDENGALAEALELREAA